MNRKGITLVELLIVIVVMGIIASFSAILVSTIIAKSKEDSFINTAKTMLVSASNAYNQNDDLWIDNVATLQELIDNDYIDTPLNDPWGVPYDTTGSFVTVELVARIIEGELYLSNAMHLAASEIFKVKLVSATATIGFDAPLAEFDNDNVIYLAGTGGFINGIIETITGNLNSPLSGDNDNDSITVDSDANSSSRINTFDGDDSVTVSGDMRGNASVDAGAGDDTVSVGRLRGRSVIDGGAGNDTITIAEIRYHTTITAGDGNDTVTIGSVTNNYRGSISMGNGDDTLTLRDPGNIFAGVNGSFSGGSGNDILNLPDVDTARWNQISSMFSGFETINLKDSTITN